MTLVVLVKPNIYRSHPVANYSTALSRFGQVNAAGADDALFLKQFGGEVLTEFEQANVFKARSFVRQIVNGKSAQFPMIGLATSAYHTPGDWIDSQNINMAEQVISVDGLLVSAVFVANIDELENHYDVRGPYSTELGRELARQYDKAAAITAIKAARSASVLTGRAGGSIITAATMSTDADILTASFFSAAQALDEKFVQSEDRSAFLKPAQYYLLAQNPKLLYKDFGGSADITHGTVRTVAGIDLVKALHMPVTNIITGLTKYQGDFTKNVAIIKNKWATGTVQLADISMESDYEPRRQGTFIVSKMAVGHDKLRPDCAIELANS